MRKWIFVFKYFSHYNTFSQNEYLLFLNDEDWWHSEILNCYLKTTAHTKDYFSNILITGWNFLTQKLHNMDYILSPKTNWARDDDFIHPNTPDETSSLLTQINSRDSESKKRFSSINWFRFSHFYLILKSNSSSTFPSLRTWQKSQACLISVMKNDAISPMRLGH